MAQPEYRNTDWSVKTEDSVTLEAEWGCKHSPPAGVLQFLEHGRVETSGACTR